MKIKGLFNFSLSRFWYIVLKEFIQMRRDRMTFAMMIGIPAVQLIIFGYAINSNPKFLPTAIQDLDNSNFSRAIVSSMKNSEYFIITKYVKSENQAETMMRKAEVQFIVTFPADFSIELMKGKKPQMLVQADAADPSAVAYAISALDGIVNSALEKELKGQRAGMLKASPVDIRLHRCFNPEIKTQINVVPGLLGVILTMTMVFITSLAVTREKERGTMETLLATPVSPLEVMTGKIIPYMTVGFVQMTLILILAKVLFGITPAGSLTLLYAAASFFIAANLAVGITISTIAKNQLQALQMSIFFFLPSLLLSGFMFPFRGMPQWAQSIGTILPLTHFLEILRGIILRGAGFFDFYAHLAWIIVFLIIIIVAGLLRYRQTLD